jgi:phosphoribosylformylglycinamidine cyclo-ligase
VQKACADSDCVLIGGETAEMPGVYSGRDFDCAGFAVGIVDQEKAWGALRVQSGNVLIGLKSSGFHSNGYSLLRKIFAEDLETYKQALLRPTRLYVDAIKKLKANGLHEKIHAASHITGGGVQNIPRVLPQGLGVQLHPWKLSHEYEEVCKRTGKDFFEMAEVLNMGLGFVLIVDPKDQEAVLKTLNSGEDLAWLLGEVTSQEGIQWKS